MNMIKETYERLLMDVTEFDVEDVIATSGVTPGGNTPPGFNPDNPWEMPVGMYARRFPENLKKPLDEEEFGSLSIVGVNPN